MSSSEESDYSDDSDYWYDVQYRCLKFSEELDSTPITTEQLRLIATVAHNDVEGLKELLDSPKWYNVEDKYGHTLLQIAICRHNKEVFDYMLSLEDFPIDAANRRGETPLQIAVTGFINEIFIEPYYAIELLKKDVKVDLVNPYFDETLLHCAFYRDFVHIARRLIEKGADVNALSQEGENRSPLHYCINYCSDENLVEGAAMLLYYGADPFIPDSDGEVAFDCVLRNSGDVALAQEILYYYTFNEYSCHTISLLSLVKAAEIKWPFFYQLIENISDVDCINCTCFEMAVLFTIELPYLKALMEKFSYVFEDFFNDVDGMLFEFVYFNEQSLQNIDMLLNSKCGSAIIEIICNTHSSELIESLIYKNTLSLMCEIICYFLSYGTTINVKDFHLVYRKLGYCELFKILLRMDVKECKFENPEIIPALFYNVKIYNIETYLQDPYKFSTKSGIEELLSYSAHPKLKKFCYELNQKSLIEKAKNLPDIPLLVELARDVFREYFIKTFNITTSKQFHMMLKMLPISDVHRKIVTFETKLY